MKAAEVAQGFDPGAIAVPHQRTWPIVVAAASVLAFQVGLASGSIAMQSAVRAYVGGESLYSKGQKGAQMALRDYLDRRQEDDFERFSAALAVPLGDRRAREALQKPEPDVAAAREGFLAGGNDPDDIDGLIWLFRWFRESRLLAPSVGLWLEGDQAVEQLRILGQTAHQRVAIDSRLTRLESEFSDQIGTASREIGHWLMALNLGSAAVLGVVGLTFMRQRLAERAAAAREMTRLVDAVGDAVVCVDPQRRIVLFNRAAETIFGAPARERLGADVRALVEPGAHQRLATLLDEAVLADDPAPPPLRVHELRAQRADGTTFPAEVSTSQVRTSSGPVITIVLRDASGQEQVRKEQEARLALEASNVAKTGFLSSMSHELRTPLNAVIGFARLMILDATRPLAEQDRVRLGHIENAGSHLLALVNDILDLSRIESGQMALSLEAVEAAEVAEEALVVTAQMAMGARVALAPLAPAGGSPGRARAARVLADRVRLQQVLINLLSNAVKYTPAGGRVELALQVREDRVDIVVADTGKGMSAEQLAHLFEPFNRLGAESSGVEGTGIGLVLTRHLVTLMHGRLDIASAEGRGTTATVSLRPAAVSAVEKAPPSRPEAVETGDVEPLDVIYVEDNEVNVELMRQIVRLRSGLALRVATSGSEAVEMARSRPPRVMLVDMQLGDMSGLDVAAQLRACPATSHIPLVVVSADALPDQIERAIGSGFEHYLTKPVNPAQLLRVLASYGTGRPAGETRDAIGIGESRSG